MFLLLYVLSNTIYSQSYLSDFLYNNYGPPLSVEMFSCSDVKLFYSHDTNLQGEVRVIYSGGTINCTPPSEGQVNIINNKYAKLLAYSPEEDNTRERYIFIGWDNEGYQINERPQIYITDSNFNLIEKIEVSNDGRNVSLSGETPAYSFSSFGSGFMRVIFTVDNKYHNSGAIFYELYVDLINEPSLNSIQNLTNNSLNVFPNPTKGKININSKSDNLLKVFDYSGKEVLKGNGHSINLQNLSDGKYILEITNKKNKKNNYKIIKE